MEFAARREGKLAGAAPEGDRAKVQSYADSLEAIRERDRKVDAMADAIRPHVPKLDAKYLADDMTTVDRQRGHVEVLLAALVSGLTNVVAFTVDELGHEYTGLAGLEAEKVNLHDVGHDKGFGKLTAEEVRFAVQRQHMTLIDTIATRLKKAPEGDGTVFDNTMIFYFPDGGETHHADGTEYPFVVLSGKNARAQHPRAVHPPAELRRPRPQDARQLVHHPAERARQPDQALRRPRPRPGPVRPRPDRGHQTVPRLILLAAFAALV